MKCRICGLWNLKVSCAFYENEVCEQCAIAALLFPDTRVVQKTATPDDPKPPLDALTSRRDELIRQLWLVYRSMSDIIKADDFKDDDLDLWVLVTKHQAVQSRLDSKELAGEAKGKSNE